MGENLKTFQCLIEDDRHTETSKFDKAHGEGSIRILDHDNDGDLDIIDS